MKKVLMALLPFMLLCACGGRNMSPEEEVRNYGKYFVEKLNANQLDSLKDTYADIVMADSIVPLKSDTIIIAESAPGSFEITLMDGVTLKVNRDDEGKISVTESKGLFAFPTDKVEIAKKTGMASDSISDKDLANRMKDEDFFKYINDKGNKLSSNLITVDKKLHLTKEAIYAMDSWKGYYNLTNNTDYPIKGSDYSVLIKWLWMGGGMMESGTAANPGKDIPPHSTIKYPVGSSGREQWKVTGVKIKIPQEELVKRFSPFTGKEYQEYLDSKK